MSSVREMMDRFRCLIDNSAAAFSSCKWAFSAPARPAPHVLGTLCSFRTRANGSLACFSSFLKFFLLIARCCLSLLFFSFWQAYTIGTLSIQNERLGAFFSWPRKYLLEDESRPIGCVCLSRACSRLLCPRGRLQLRNVGFWLSRRATSRCA